MNKMTVIQLLNKIANGEEVPKKVRYNDELYDTEISNNFSLMIYEATGKMCDDGEVQLFLNDEVEILEEEKKIPEKLKIEDNGNTITLYGEKENEWTILDNVDIIVCNKINSIIDYLKSKGE